MHIYYRQVTIGRPAAQALLEDSDRHSGESRNPEQNLVMEKAFAVYILASRRNGTLYIGVTSDLIRRVWEHRSGHMEGFTKKYGVHLLVYYEFHETAESAIVREKQMKEWKRRWKLELIEQSNPDWIDLYDELTGPRLSPG